jgi:peptidyl-prolyl cis-trans isomerase B (cyclophilin B)
MLKLILPLIALLFVGLIPVFAETEISDKVVVLHTQSGDMVIELFPADAPKTVANFLNLTEHGFYDRTVFHRVIKDFMIQGGDPKTKPHGYQSVTEWGTGNAGYTILGEFNTISHKRGIVSMARGSDPDSGSSQFFIVHKDSLFLDQNYAVFGRLATNASYATLDKIANLTTGGESTNYIPFDWGKGEILKAEVKNRSEIPDLIDLGEPVRVSTPVNQTAQEYSNEKLGISFLPPLGWTVQEPQKTNSQTPDVVTIGTTIGGFTPSISISVKNNNGTSLDNYADTTKKSLKKAIDEGIVTILQEERTTINGNDALITDVVGKFTTTGGQAKIKFKEAVIRNSDKFYIITYSNSENNFNSTLPKFTDVLNSLKIISTSPTIQNPIPNDKNGGGCLVATATFGSELAPQIQTLRELRDNMVQNTNSGAAFMTEFNQFYYSFSPTIADWERQNPIFKETVKITITPMLSTLSMLNYVDMHSEQELLGYGLGIILLNIGMYFVVPTIIILKTKDRLGKFIR